MGGNHDKLTDLSRFPTTRRRLRPPQDTDRRGGARRLRRHDERRLCSLRRAARPDRRADHVNRSRCRSARFPAAAIRTLVWSRRRSPRFRSGHRLPGLRRHHGGRARRDRVPLGRRPGLLRSRAISCCSATFPTTASCASRRMTVTLSVYRQPSMNSNGNTIDREGRLITCEHAGRRVTRTELDGSITIIADKYNGKQLNSPNDAVVTADGAIWFTDPGLRHRRLLRGHQGRRRAGQEERLPGRSEIRRRQGRRR